MAVARAKDIFEMVSNDWGRNEGLLKILIEEGILSKPIGLIGAYCYCRL